MSSFWTLLLGVALGGLIVNTAYVVLMLIQSRKEDEYDD